MSRWQPWAWGLWRPWSWLLSLLFGCRGRGFQRGICCGHRGGLSSSGVCVGGRLVRPASRHLAPVGLPRRRRGDIGLNHHMRCYRTGGIHHATSTKDPTSRRHKPRGHKRSARARGTAIGTGRIEPRGVNGKAKQIPLGSYPIGAYRKPCP